MAGSRDATGYECSLTSSVSVFTPYPAPNAARAPGACRDRTLCMQKPAPTDMFCRNERAFELAKTTR